MTRHLVTCLTIIALSFVSPTRAAAATFATSSAVYDTIDAIEVTGSSSLDITGIISGQGSPSTLSYSINSLGSAGGEAPFRCERLALLAMSKPGKFQLAMNFFLGLGDGFTCKLIVRTP